MQYTLMDVIKKLESYPPSTVLSPGFSSPHSYRGYYDRVAFTPLPSAPVEHMLAAAELALNNTFEGYKGGEYLMEEDTLCHVAEYGQCDSEHDFLHEYWFKVEKTPLPPSKFEIKLMLDVDDYHPSSDVNGTRIFLNRDEAGNLAKLLQRYADTGSL